MAMYGWMISLLTVVILAAANGLPFSEPEPKDSSYRLKEELTPSPINYAIRLTPDLLNSKFSGQLTLTVSGPKEPTDTITLHAKNISVTSASVHADGDPSQKYGTNITYDFVKDFLFIQLTGSLLSNENYIINIEYLGILHDDMYGFYMSSYIDDKGNTRFIAATQFQPTHARKAFPCFDEPMYKATFEITIDTPAGFKSLCNTNLKNKPEEGKQADYIFEKTPKMSTYLVAFVVSDFESLNVSANGILYQTWARKNAILAGKYSIEITPRIVQSLESYTSIKYSHSGLSKVDQVALPDFSAGAMENWGLVTYREIALLFQDGASTAAAKQRIATIITHEIAHMWFGNLVTTAWWNTTWLNEGFADYFENYISSKVEPDMRIMDQFVVAVQQTVFEADSLKSAKPLTSECNTPAEVTAMFSTITYSKGGSVLRMLNHSLTEEKFQSALRSYLTDRSFNYSDPNHLMNHLSEVAPNDDFEKVFSSWTTQAGYPLITVTRDYTANTTTVSQSRFLLSTVGESDSQTWSVPLNWATTLEEFEDTRPKTWLDKTEMEIQGMPPADKWVIFNIQETGYYRVNYDAYNWKLLETALMKEPECIHVLNRAQLVDDALNLARIGKLSYGTALRITQFLVNEADYIPWRSGLIGINFLDRRLRAHKEYSCFKDFVLGLVKGIYEKLGFKDSNGHVDKLHRSVVLSIACNAGHNECLGNATEKLQSLIKSKGTNKVEPDLQSVVYCYGLMNSMGTESWDYLWNMYKESDDASEKTLLLTSLGCTNNKTILEEYLEKSIKDSAIRKQDAAMVFSAVYNNPEGVGTAVNFLSNNFPAISSYYGSMGGIENIVKGLAARITDESQKKTFEEFLSKNSAQLGSVVETATQSLEDNFSWAKTYQDIIIKELKDMTDNGGGGQSDNAGIISSPGLATFFTMLVSSLSISYIFIFNNL